jgi:hypothetical protein
MNERASTAANRSVPRGICFRGRLSAQRAGAVPRSAAAELGVASPFAS